MSELIGNRLDTGRLLLVPLDLNYLLLYKKQDGSIEKELGTYPTKQLLTEEMKLILERSVIPFLMIYPNDTLFGTLWVIIDKVQNIVVGDIGFKGTPDVNGIIEVGYSTNSMFQNRGYMTEALALISKWAFTQPNVFTILAETDKINLPSQKVLVKNEFIRFFEIADTYWWYLRKK
jgi:ribosomal-protein-alanine N-acetyltransferase